MYYRTCADEYLYTLAPVFGRVAAIDRPLGFYRLHADNVYSSRPTREKLAMELDGHSQQCHALAATLARHGIAVDVERWNRNSWFHRLQRAVDEIESVIPGGATFLLADDDTWAADLFADRHVVTANSLTDTGGPPTDDMDATTLLSAMSRFDLLVFAWPAFWWFDAYPCFFEHLGSQFHVVSDSEVTRILKRNGA